MISPPYTPRDVVKDLRQLIDNHEPRSPDVDHRYVSTALIETYRHTSLIVTAQGPNGLVQHFEVSVREAKEEDMP